MAIFRFDVSPGGNVLFRYLVLYYIQTFFRAIESLLYPFNRNNPVFTVVSTDTFVNFFFFICKMSRICQYFESSKNIVA